MTTSAVSFGPRLVGSPAGTLRAALVARPSVRIERASPLIGEPGAIFGRAIEQFDVLVRTLRYFEVAVTVVEAGEEDPLACAVADDAVLFESGATLMRPARMSRRNEPERLAAKFAAIDVPLGGRISAPGLLDGGDILLVDDLAFVGVGASGNEVGRAGFAQIARAGGFEVRYVTLAPGVRSLRSVAGLLGSRTVALATEKADAAPFDGLEIVAIERGEESAAGVVTLGDRHVIADVRYRTALRAMRRVGIEVEGLDLYEFEKIGITPSMLVLPLARA
ncbi:MAG: hypothetical protein ACREMP_06905 [Candidatus Tyrphobacter sp.]